MYITGASGVALLVHGGQLFAGDAGATGTSTPGSRRC
jgi:hypothetical protein